jgi:hypothetical protein
MMFKEIIALYAENTAKAISMYIQNIELQSVKSCGIRLGFEGLTRTSELSACPGLRIAVLKAHETRD